MNVKYVCTLVTGVVECLFYSGLLFGWASLVFVLKEENYFCADSNVSVDASTTVTPGEEPGFSANSSISGASNFSATTTLFTATAVKDLNGSIKDIKDCSTQQSVQLNTVFIVASMLLSFSTFPNGYIFDTMGTWVARVIALILFSIGCILASVSSPETSWLLYASMSFMSIGGILLLVTNLQIGNLFGKYRSSVITLLSGSLDSSSFVFLIFKALHQSGVQLNAMFQVMACSTVLLWLRTFILLPRKKYPFPLPKDYNYGVLDCTKANSNEENELSMKNGIDSEEKMALKIKAAESVPTARPLPPMMYFVKSTLFWGNALHFSILQLRNYFYMGMLNDSLLQMTNETSILSSYLTVFGTCQLFGFLCAPMNGLLVDGVSKILRKKNMDAGTIRLLAASYSAITTTVLGIVFSIFVSIPYLPVQYGSFVLQVVFRSFLYGGNYNFIATIFPGQHYGKLYGLTMCIGGVMLLLQFPLTTLVLDVMDSNFTTINIVFIIVSIVTILHPLNIHRICRRKMATQKAIVRHRVKE